MSAQEQHPVNPNKLSKEEREKVNNNLKARISELHQAIRSRDIDAALKVFASDAKISDPKTGQFSRTPQEYLTELLKHGDGVAESLVDVVSPVFHYIGDAGLAPVVEDFVFSNAKSPRADLSQIVIYYINNDAKINKAEVFQQEAVDHGKGNLTKAMNNYYKEVNHGTKASVRELYAEDFKIFDPVGIPNRTFDSVYDTVFSAKSFHLTVSRIYSAFNSRCNLVYGEFVDDENISFHANPIQRFQFDEHEKIVEFRAHFLILWEIREFRENPNVTFDH
jgi:hypothetical protein